MIENIIKKIRIFGIEEEGESNKTSSQKGGSHDITHFRQESDKDG